MSARAKSNATSGLVIVDKSGGMTSHDVVGRMRRIAHTRKIGHAGTLDPMATGVLVIGVEKATRLLHHLVLTDKTYTATIRLGQSTITDDAEGSVTGGGSATAITEDDIRTAILELSGDILQVPSAVSAIKVDGERAYKRVRDGEQVALAARAVTVSRFEVLGFARPDPTLLDVEVIIDCSSGTYVRALARDLGEILGVGGHLTVLRRTRVGPFTIEQAQTLDELAALDDPVTLPLPDAVRAAMPVRIVSAAQAVELAHGRAVEPEHRTGVYGALLEDGTVVALMRDDPAAGRPVLVFTPAG